MHILDAVVFMHILVAVIFMHILNAFDIYHVSYVNLIDRFPLVYIYICIYIYNQEHGVQSLRTPERLAALL